MECCECGSASLPQLQQEKGKESRFFILGVRSDQGSIPVCFVYFRACNNIKTTNAQVKRVNKSKCNKENLDINKNAAQRTQERGYCLIVDVMYYCCLGASLEIS